MGKFGSQGRAERSLFRFMKIKLIVPALVALAFPIAVGAAPAQPVKANKVPAKVEIDAKARAIFARAVVLYKPLKTVRLEWKTDAVYRYVMGGTAFKSPSSYVSTLDYSREGGLKVQRPNEFTFLDLVNGKMKWTVDNHHSDDAGKSRLTYHEENIDSGGIYNELQMELWTSAPPLSEELGNLLAGTNSLDAPHVNVIVVAEKLLQLRVSLLPPLAMNGQVCDLVRFTKRYKDIGAKAATILQETFWFERASGRLVRAQTHSVTGPNDSKTSDQQVTAQTFNPKFAPDTFKFTPPKGAVLQKN